MKTPRHSLPSLSLTSTGSKVKWFVAFGVQLLVLACISWSQDSPTPVPWSVQFDSNAVWKPEVPVYAYPVAPHTGPATSFPVSGSEAFISAATSSAKAGETILIHGHGFDSPTVTIFDSQGNLLDDSAPLVMFEPDAVAVRLNVANANQMLFAKVSQNSSLSAPSQTIRINATDAWWLGPRRLPGGQTVSVFGQNLGLPGVAATVYWRSTDGTRSATVPVSTSFDGQKADFAAPSEVGIYEVWISNGSGGGCGWSGPLVLEVIPDNQNCRFVNSNTLSSDRIGYFPNGNQTLQQALDSLATQSGMIGELRVHPGEYEINDTLVVPRGIRLSGLQSGSGQKPAIKIKLRRAYVTVNGTTQLKNYSHGIQLEGNSAIDGFMIEMFRGSPSNADDPVTPGAVSRGIVGAINTNRKNAISMSYQVGASIRNCDIVSPPFYSNFAIMVSGFQDVWIEGNTFGTEKGCFLEAGNQMFVFGNRHTGDSDTIDNQGNAFVVKRSSDVCLIGNETDSPRRYDPDPAQRRAALRGIVFQADGCNSNAFVASNIISNTRPLGGSNSGENILFEASAEYNGVLFPLVAEGEGISIQPGSPERFVLRKNSAEQDGFFTTLSATMKSDGPNGRIVRVVEGKGKGQVRRIHSVEPSADPDQKVIVLESPFAVTPLANDSIIQITVGNHRFIATSNIVSASFLSEGVEVAGFDAFGFDTQELKATTNPDGLPDQYFRSLPAPSNTRLKYLDKYDTASAGIAVFGSAAAGVISNNRISGMQIGCYVDALVRRKDFVSEIAIVDNLITHCLDGLALRNSLARDGTGAAAAPALAKKADFMASVSVRRNRIKDCAAHGILLDGLHSPKGRDYPTRVPPNLAIGEGPYWGRYAVIESNDVQNVAVGLRIGGNQFAPLICKNTFRLSAIAEGFPGELPSFDFDSEPELKIDERIGILLLRKEQGMAGHSFAILQDNRFPELQEDPLPRSTTGSQKVGIDFPLVAFGDPDDGLLAAWEIDSGSLMDDGDIIPDVSPNQLDAHVKLLDPSDSQWNSEFTGDERVVVNHPIRLGKFNLRTPADVFAWNYWPRFAGTPETDREAGQKFTVITWFSSSYSQATPDAVRNYHLFATEESNNTDHRGMGFFRTTQGNFPFLRGSQGSLSISNVSLFNLRSFDVVGNGAKTVFVAVTYDGGTLRPLTGYIADFSSTQLTVKQMSADLPADFRLGYLDGRYRPAGNTTWKMRPFVIGGRRLNPAESGFQGTIELVRVYDRALTQNEVAAIFTHDKPRFSPPE